MLSITTLFSGSTKNAALIKNGDRLALIDAGGNRKSIADLLKNMGLDIGNVEAIFVTHEHYDHTAALGVIVKKNPGIKIYMGKAMLAGIRSFENIAGNVTFISPGEPTEAAGLEFIPFDTPHDVPQSFGYIICENGEKRIGYATDMGHITDDIMSALSGCKTVLIESNHDEKMLMVGPYPYDLKMRILSGTGHLSNEACALAMTELEKSGTKQFILAHLSDTNNMPEIALANGRNAVCGDTAVAVAPKSVPSEEFYA